MLIIIFLILLFLFGFEMTFLFKIKTGFPERIAVSYLLGIGIFTFIVFLFSWVFNINFSRDNTLIFLSAFCFFFFVLKHKDVFGYIKSINIKIKRLKLKTVLFWGLIAAIFIFTLVVNLYWPITDWDSFALYDFRAKLFLIDTNLVHAALNNNYFLGYPLLTSIGHLFVYQMGISNPKFIYSLFYLSFLIIFYNSLKRNVDENKSMIFTIILALVPEILTHSMMAYTNLPYVIYICSGTFYLYEWIKSKELAYLYLSAILVGLSTWVRIAEPFWLGIFLTVFVISLKRKKINEFIFYIAPLSIIYLTWQYFSYYIGKSGNFSAYANLLNATSVKNSLSIHSMVNILIYLFINVFLSWGIILPIFVFSVIKYYSERKKDVRKSFLYLVLIYIGILIAGTLGFSILFPGWQNIPDSARRMSMFLVPLMIYWIALSFGKIYEGK